MPFVIEENFCDDDSFMDKGILDSTGILELIDFIENEFDIKVENDEIIPDNLDSLKKLTNYVIGKMHNASQ